MDDPVAKLEDPGPASRIAARTNPASNAPSFAQLDRGVLVDAKAYPGHVDGLATRLAAGETLGSRKWGCMEVIICSDAVRVGEVAAAKAARLASAGGPGVVLGVATGSSPVRTFAELARLVDSGRLDLSQASAFALDEYVGLPKGHSQSYHEVIRRTVTEPMHLDPARVHVPDGFAEDLPGACEAYEQAIRAAGGVDIQFLGVGANGHIGFNEPTSSLSSRTRIKTLAERTRRDNARFFSSIDEVPRHCLTQGLGTIMDAHNIILVATGETKAHAIAQIVEGPVTAMYPGSVLQFHPHATIVVDEAAAAELALADYYRETYANLPAWQRLAV